ncbi:transposase [Kribbella sp. NPDC050820]|uniref:IS110 family transposase n=1 Tax=Kribbella sp. NPDC050820 TaxID=3155408 RepID=UPI0033C70FAD
MSDGSGVSRGDRNRNARLARLRVLVPLSNAIVGIDLADNKQVVVVTDHDSKVLARRTFRCRAWDLSTALDWAAERARATGFAGVTVSCEPTGHRWRVLGQLAADRSMPFVCVQPIQTSWARRSEDLTFDKTDDKDAILIARLTAQLRCYVPEPVEETWGRLRHLGTRRERLIGRGGRAGPADARPARVRLARRVGDGQLPVPVPHLGGRDVGRRGPRQRRLVPDPAPRPGSVRDRRAPRDHPPGRAQALPAHRPQALRRAQ